MRDTDLLIGHGGEGGRGEMKFGISCKLPEASNPRVRGRGRGRNGLRIVAVCVAKKNTRGNDVSPCFLSFVQRKRRKPMPSTILLPHCHGKPWASPISFSLPDIQTRRFLIIIYKNVTYAFHRTMKGIITESLIFYLEYTRYCDINDSR